MSVKTEFGPGKTPLYYTNVGLFSDPFLEDRLPHLEKYYSHPSTHFLNEYWNIDESDAVKFNNAFQDITDLWNKLDQNVPKFCTRERQLQNTWIDKIFGYLGWTIELEESSTQQGITNYPDYALFANEEDWKKSKDLGGTNKFKRAIAIGDAKDWGVNLDGKGLSNKNPSYQIVNYLRQTEKTWGILTDGRYWRIYSLRPDSKHTVYYEVDLEKILSTGDSQRFKYFYNFFRAEAFLKDARLTDRTFLDFVYEDGRLYSKKVEDNLKERAFEVVESICKGFVYNKRKLSEDELKEVYDHSLYYLFKLLFILNCESKGLLEVNKQDDYYNNGSLRKKCIEIKDQADQRITWSNQPRTYNYISDLFKLLEEGDSRIGVHGFGNEVFATGNNSFYKKNTIPDQYLNSALLHLATKEDDAGKDKLFIDYKILSPDHIGSLFEGLLEYKLVQDGKEVLLLNDKGERKKSASYYTPDYIVDFIVKEAVENLTKEKDTSEILKLTVCDPAMGSGHFLLGTMKFLEEHVQKYQNDNPKSPTNLPFNEIKKIIMKQCIFGVDKNELAVVLAKFSLWIYTAEKGDNLKSLKGQFKLGNSLVDNKKDHPRNFVWHEEFEEVFKAGGFDAVVGNPPYLGEKGNKDIFREAREHGVLAKETYMRKMDLFYWFIMRGIDLVKDGRYVSYITTNYWPTADGAEKLKSYLIEHTAMVKYIDFLGSTIFKDAKGQSNSIFVLKKCPDWNKTKLDIFRANKPFVEESLKWREELPIENKNYFEHESADLKKVCPNGSQWTLSKKSSASNSTEETSGSENKIKRDNYSKFFEKDAVSMGVQTAADKVTKALLELAADKKLIKSGEVQNFEVKEGIYVLSQDQSSEKKIESDLLLDWYKNSDIGFYFFDTNDCEKLIYVDSEIDINKFPNAKAHLQRYRQLLAAREQANNDEDNWFWIRGAKRDKIYKRTTLVCPYRSPVPKFCLSKGEVYGAGDMYFVIDFFGFEPEVLLGYLNSSFILDWHKVYGKKKGKIFELYQTPLSEIPVPVLSKSACTEIKTNVDKIHKEIKNLQKQIQNTATVKTILDIISENRSHFVKAVSNHFKEKNIIEFTQNIAVFLANIDEVVYREMLPAKTKKAV